MLGPIASRALQPCNIFDPSGPGLAYVDGKTLTDSKFDPQWRSFLEDTWSALPLDKYHSGGNHQVRFRAHDHLLFRAGAEWPSVLPHLPFVLDQGADNTYGGQIREFPPVKYAASTFMLQFLKDLRNQFMKPLGDALVTMVQFRTIAPADGSWVGISDGGPHWDGFDALTISVIHRDRHAEGGLTQVFDKGTNKLQFQGDLSTPWSTVVVDDRNKLHHATQMRSTLPGSVAIRDILITDWVRTSDIVPYYVELLHQISLAHHGRLPSRSGPPINMEELEIKLKN